MRLRTGIVGAAALVGLVAVASSGIGAAALPGTRSETSRQRIGDSFRIVRVDNEVGDVRIEPGIRSAVTFTEQWLVARPDVRIERRGDVLDIRADCPDVVLDDCRVDFDITVPTASTAIVEVDAGSIEVASLSGNHHLETASGSIEAIDIGSPTAVIHAATGAGSVDLHDVRARTIETVAASGEIDVDAAEITGDVVARAESGDVDVAVPAGRYALFTDAGAGSERVVGVISDASAARTVTATTDAGSVLVRARGTSVPPDGDATDDEPAGGDASDDGEGSGASRSTSTTRPPREETASSTTTSTSAPGRSTTTTAPQDDDLDDDLGGDGSPLTLP